MKRILKEQIDLIRPAKKELLEIKKEVNLFVEELKKEDNRGKQKGDVFVGGSFAKGTLVKKDKYDVDVFVRFDWKYEKLSELLVKPLKNLGKRHKWKVERIHGSRDYFRVYFSDKSYFEVIPVTKIKHPREERNVTDLSYFHVPYIKKRIKGLEEDIMLAKTFCHAQKVYGAETYVQGFSGYALELLVIHYKGFKKMLKQLIKVRKDNRLIVDPEKHYKRKNDVLFDMNEAKLQSPIILVDPTYKERNALAALSRETFERFQSAAKKFLRNPKKNYFVKKPIDVKKLRKIKGEFIHVKLETDRQEGDIAGTKLKKFSEFLIMEMKEYFKIKRDEFDYNDSKDADLYLVVESKREIIRMGPPNYTKKLRKHIQAFKKEHKKTFVKEGILHAKIKVNFTGKEFIQKLKRRDEVKDMGITGIKIK